MKETVDLWDIEMLSHPKAHKNIFIFMKRNQRLLEAGDCISCLRGQLGQIQKVKKCTCGLDNLCCTQPIGKMEINDESQENLAYIFVLLA